MHEGKANLPSQPTPYVRAAPLPPTGHWLKRGLTALLVEHRLPHRATVAVDKFCNVLGLRRKTVRAGGFKVRVRRRTCDELFVQNIIVNEEYTPPGFTIRESDVIIDIGGNIGTFALLSARYARRGKVVTVEPNQENYDLLLRNIRVNKLENVVPVRAAVSARQGEVKLFRAAQGGFHSLLEDRPLVGDRFDFVPSITLQDVFDNHDIKQCNLLKLDCEGAEYEILLTLPSAYFLRIDKIVMEYHGDRDAIRRRARTNALVAHIERQGFRIDAYQEFTDFPGGFIRATRPGR